MIAFLKAVLDVANVTKCIPLEKQNIMMFGYAQLPDKKERQSVGLSKS